MPTVSVFASDNERESCPICIFREFGLNYGMGLNNDVVPVSVACINNCRILSAISRYWGR